MHRYLEHERKKHEEEARLMKNVSIEMKLSKLIWSVFR